MPNTQHTEHAATDPRIAEYYVAYDQWISRNPIRTRRLQIREMVHRRTRPLSQSKLATRIEKSPLSIQNWEGGSVTPSKESFEKLAQFFDDPNIEDEWIAWHAQQPKSPLPEIVSETVASEKRGKRPTTKKA
ncbi:MAG: helix-turn-helix domain-containing protein [Ktedonobacterales bacterium]